MAPAGVWAARNRRPTVGKYMKQVIRSGIMKICACYTAPLAQMSAAFRRKLFLTILSALIVSCQVHAQEPANPFAPQAVQLVTEMMNRAGSPGFVTLDVQNKSSLSTADL